MAKISTFSDDFPGTALSGSWQTYGSPPTPTVGSGLLTLSSRSDTTEAGIETVSSYDFTESQIDVKFVLGSTQENMLFGPRYSSGSSVPVILFGGSYLAFGSWSGSYTNLVGVYPAHAYARIVFEPGSTSNVKYYSSSDGVSYTLQYTNDLTNYGTLTSRALGLWSKTASLSWQIDSVGTPSASSVAFRPYYITG